MASAAEIDQVILRKNKDLASRYFIGGGFRSLLILYDLLNQFPDDLYLVSTRILKLNHDYDNVTYYLLDEWGTALENMEDPESKLFEARNLEDLFSEPCHYPLGDGKIAFPLIGNHVLSLELSYPANDRNILGYMVLEIDPASVNEDEILFLLRFGRRLGPAIHKKIMVERLRDISSKLKKLNETYLNLIAFVSHELRSPLVGIGVDVKLLLKGAYGAIEENVKKIGKTIEMIIRHYSVNSM